MTRPVRLAPLPARWDAGSGAKDVQITGGDGNRAPGRGSGAAPEADESAVARR